MPTVQDIYDIATYDEAKTETEKLRAIIHMIVRRRDVTPREILTWSTVEFFQTAKDIVDAIDPNRTQVPTAFAHAFECKKACCQDASLLLDIVAAFHMWKNEIPPYHMSYSTTIEFTNKILDRLACVS